MANQTGSTKAAITGLIACAIWWLLLSPKSPLSSFSGVIGDIWMVVHFPVYFVLILITPDEPLGAVATYIGVFAQWFVISSIVMYIYDLRSYRKLPMP
jgi:hypothetical protein